MNKKAQLKRISIILSILLVLTIFFVSAFVNGIDLTNEKIALILKYHPEVFENKTLDEALSLRIIDIEEPIDYINFKSNIGCNIKNACENTKCLPNRDRCSNDGEYFTFNKSDNDLINIVKRNCKLDTEENYRILLIFKNKLSSYTCQGYDAEYHVILQ